MESVPPGSTVEGRVRVGDALMSVDGLDVSDMSVQGEGANADLLTIWMTK